MSIIINGTHGHFPAAGTVPKRSVPGFEDVLEKALPNENEGTPESPETSQAEQTTQTAQTSQTAAEKFPCLECKVRDECQYYLELTGGDPSYAENAGTEREFPGDILCTVGATIPTVGQNGYTEYDYTNVYPYLEINRRYN